MLKRIIITCFSLLLSCNVYEGEIEKENISITLDITNELNTEILEIYIKKTIDSSWGDSLIIEPLGLAESTSYSFETNRQSFYYLAIDRDLNYYSNQQNIKLLDVNIGSDNQTNSDLSFDDYIIMKKNNFVQNHTTSYVAEIYQNDEFTITGSVDYITNTNEPFLDSNYISIEESFYFQVIDSGIEFENTLKVIYELYDEYFKIVGTKQYIEIPYDTSYELPYRARIGDSGTAYEYLFQSGTYSKQTWELLSYKNGYANYVTTTIATDSNTGYILSKTIINNILNCNGDIIRIVTDYESYEDNVLNYKSSTYCYPKSKIKLLND